MRLESFEFTALTTAIFVKNSVSYVPNADSFRRIACTCKSLILNNAIEMISGSEIFYESSNLMNL